jgi:uncharacterized protein
LVLGNKAFQAAEEYVLGLFHLYFAVYFHKATRSAEKMLSALIKGLGDIVAHGGDLPDGLSERNPLVRFLRAPSLESYLALDDTTIWSIIRDVSGCGEPELAELARRILERRLYKSLDISAMSEGRGGEAAVAGFRVDSLRPETRESWARWTFSKTQLRGYENEALEKVLIRRPDGTSHQDLAERSEVVRALQKKTIYRVYAKDEDTRERVREIARGVGL